MVKKEYQIIAKNYDLAGRASSDIKRTLKSMNTCRSLMKRVCSSSYEAEINIVIHSYGGYAIFEMNDHEIRLEFHDDGPGILDIELAMQEGYSTATEHDHMNGFGAGMGLSNIKKSADTMDLKSTIDGTDLILTFKITGECYDED
ncbi:MAG: anti-sigma regulatory factor [Bacillota bacterium]|nr:MAG: anti-sigma regulatory factor [Bacillota bacterium]